MIRTAVVILNFNGKEYLRQFLPGVIQYSPGAQIVVADNASTDNSVKFITDSFPSVGLIQLDRNYGFAGGYNRAIVEVDVDLLILLNSDVEVTPGWLEPLSSAFADKELAAAQPKLRSFTHRDTFDYAGAAGGFIDILGYPYCRGRLFSTLEKDEGQYDGVIDVFWASGACLVIRKEVFQRVGGFDERFFAHMEEIDLCWRIHLMGLNVKCIPQSVIYHVGGGTLSRLSPRKTYLNFRNSLSMLAKNEPYGGLIWKMPVRGVLDLVAALKFLLEGSPRHSWAVVKAQLYFWTHLFSDLRKRSGRKLLPIPLMKGVVVMSYYLSGRKRYSDLNH